MDEKNKIIGQEVFNCYINSDSKVEFNKYLKELSLKYNKTTSFLRQIRDDYYRYCASENEKMEYDAIKEAHNQIVKYKDIIEILLPMSNEERKKFLEESEITRSAFNQYMKFYMKRISKNDNIKELDKWVKEYYDSKLKNKIDDKKIEILKEAKTKIDELVQNGYYHITDYVNDYYNKYNIEKYYFGQMIHNYFEFLKSNDLKLYNYYSNEMEKNRIIKFNNLKSKIDYFIENISNLDIVDYYSMFDMDIRSFLRLCRNLISKETKIKYSVFFNKYLEIDKDIISDEQILNSNYEFFGVMPSISDKQEVLNYMKQNNVPNVYFSVALKKYILGSLNVNKKIGK